MIKKYFVLLFFFFLTIGHAQSPQKFTYQSIIKTSAGYLLKNQDVGLKISVLFNSSNGIAVYSEEHTVESNNNGLVTLIIGEGVSSDVFSDIDWGGGEFFLKVEVDPEGGINYTMNQTSQLLSVPYALYAENSSVNLSVIGQSYITYSGNQISANKIDASNDITGLSNVGISGDYADLTNTPTLFDGDYTSLANKPTLFDGDYANLTNTPTLFDGDYANLTNTPTLFDGDYTSLTNKPTLFDGDYANLTNTPTLFDGDYTSLANKPTLFDGDYANLTNTPTLFDGDYTSLTNNPELDDGKIYMGDSNNKSAQITVSGDVTLANTGAVTIADDAVTTAKLANIAQGSILVGGASDAPTVYDASGDGKILVGDDTDIASVAVSGDVTLANTGAVTIADDAVTTAKLANIAQGSILVGGASDAPTVYDASGDGKILVGDGTDIASVAVSGDVTLANTGAVTIADDAVTTAKLANIAQGSILVGGASDAPTVYDASGDGKILVGDDTDIASVAVSGDVTLANTGAVTIADDAVTTAKLANIAQGSILVGGASDAPTVYDASGDGKILVGDDTDIASVAVSGDVTLANTGAVTIADDAVTTAKLANIAQGSILVGGASDAPTVYDASGDGKILVGDDTDIASVAVSGDVTLANTGAVTIADDAVTTAKLANIAQGSILVGGASDAPTVYDASGDGKILVGDDTDIASVAVSGDVTLANTGAVTIADDAVTTAKLANIAQGSILVGGASDAPTVYDASGDGKILVGDDTDIASVAVSGDVTLANTGAVTIADDAVTTAKLANIAQGSILVGGASDAPTVYDASGDGKILVGDDTDIASVAVSGDVTLANTGAVTIADDAVTTAKLANIAQGSILVGGASDAPTVYDASGDGKILVGDGTDIASVAVSGDVTLANTGAVTIADDAVTTAKLANIAQGSILVGGASDAPTVYDASGDGKILVGDDTDIASVAVSGDVTLANTGAVTIADDAVTTAKLANIAQGSILVGGASDAPTVYDASGDGKILVGDGTDIASVAVSGDVTLANTGAVTIADDAVNLTTKVAGVLPIANGGTGVTNADAANSALNSLGVFTGTGTISSGNGATVTISDSNVTSSSKIFLTFTSDTDGGPYLLIICLQGHSELPPQPYKEGEHLIT